MSPHRTIALPGTRLALNCLLAHAVHGVGLNWFMSEPPSTAVPAMLHPFGDRWLEQPATSPPSCSLAIWLAAMGDRPIVVRPQTPHHSYVTIWDVLNTIYSKLRSAAQAPLHASYQPIITFSPYSPAPGTPVFRPQLNEAQIRDMIQRFLRGKVFWNGLTRTPDDPHSWELHVR